MKMIEMCVTDLLKRYAEGERDFNRVKIKPLEWVEFEVGTSLYGAHFHFADLSDIRLTGVSLRGCEFIETVMPDEMIGVDLMDSYLQRVNLSGRDLYGANMVCAKIVGSSLDNANMQKVNMASAEVQISGFNKTDLRKAQLYNSNIYYTDFRGADLRDVDIDDITLERNDFCDAKGMRKLIGPGNFGQYVDNQSAPFYVRPPRTRKLPDKVTAPDSRYNIVNQRAILAR